MNRVPNDIGWLHFTDNHVVPDVLEGQVQMEGIHQPGPQGYIISEMAAFTACSPEKTVHLTKKIVGDSSCFPVLSALRLPLHGGLEVWQEIITRSLQSVANSDLRSLPCRIFFSRNK